MCEKSVTTHIIPQQSHFYYNTALYLRCNVFVNWRNIMCHNELVIFVYECVWVLLLPNGKHLLSLPSITEYETIYDTCFAFFIRHYCVCLWALVCVGFVAQINSYLINNRINNKWNIMACRTNCNVTHSLF